MTSARFQRCGFSLVETIFCTLLAGTLLVAALQTVSAARWGQYNNAMASRGMALAQSLWAEIEPLDYEDPNAPGTLGLESGESTTTRATLNDVDDYQGLALNPVTDINGVVLPSYTGWEVDVTVQYADPENPDRDAATESGLKRITINAVYQNRTWATLTGLKCKVTS